MSKKIRVIIFVLLCCIGVKAQLIQGTLRPNGATDEFEIWLKPGFTNSTQYLFQIGLPIAFPATASPQPTGISVVLDPSFITNFGSNYTVTVNPVATATGGLEKYFNIVLVRGGAGSSVAQSWTSGTSFKVLTGTFTYASGATTFLAKLADYQDGGSDGQGNFYTQDGNNNYYVTSTSTGNFYALPGNSQVGGTATAGYVQLVSTVLPVELLNFSGQKSGTKNTLQWTTATEINNNGFEIQRSADGANYMPIGFVKSLATNGNSSSLLHYSFEDNAPVGNQQYYRLRQLDIDGNSKLSPVVEISGEQPSVLSIGRLFPNPANEQLTIQLNVPAKEVLTLIVVDEYGRQALAKEVGVDVGTNMISVDVSRLARGNYVVKFVCKEGCEKLAGRFVKQ